MQPVTASQVSPSVSEEKESNGEKSKTESIARSIAICVGSIFFALGAVGLFVGFLSENPFLVLGGGLFAVVGAVILVFSGVDFGVSSDSTDHHHCDYSHSLHRRRAIHHRHHSHDGREIPEWRDGKIRHRHHH